MNFANLKLSEKLVPANYLKLAVDAQKCKQTKFKELLEKRTLPTHGWTDEEIEEFVHYIASLDSNNFEQKSGLGEREARIVCRLVAKRHYNLGHGVGRSGDLLESQPKAAGSTVLANLVNTLLLHLIKAAGVQSCKFCFLLPMATGMSLNLCMLALKKERPKAKYVIWSRIDQKSCFKSITCAGLIPIIVDQSAVYEEQGRLVTDIDKILENVNKLPTEEILCIFSTTSCFAPRSCDNIIELAKIAKQYNLPHLINNAYGLQSTYCTHQLEQAQRIGRVDLFVQSTDKNLMVPVGGAIIAGFDESRVRNVAKSYAGRASSSQSLDVLMTLLSLGKSGYLQYVKDRSENYKYLKNELEKFAKHHQEIVIAKGNTISMALTLSTFIMHYEDKQHLSKFGSMLYTRGVSGVRVVTTADNKDIDGHSFKNWGAHTSNFKTPYLTVAAAMGITRSEIDTFLNKLEACWQLFLKKEDNTNK